MSDTYRAGSSLGLETYSNQRNIVLAAGLRRIALAIETALPVSAGTFTLAASASTVVANPAVTANSIIGLTAQNASAATLMGSVKSLYVSAKSAGVSFTVSTANAAAAAGTEQFSYTVVNPG